MARVIVIRITVDNRDAINAIKAQREEQRRLNEQVRFNQQQAQSAALANARLAQAQQQASHVQQGLTNSFIKGNLAARAISATYLTLRDSIVYAFTEVNKLELTLTKIQAVTGATKYQTLQLDEVILGLGRNLSASTTDIADAALELAKLGFSGQNLQIVLSGVTQLSSVLGDSLEATGQLVGGVVNAFNLSAEQAATVADKLFVATGKSATNIEGFKVAFSLAASGAEDAGIKFEEFAAAVAALSNQGIRSSTIGTGLRNFIGELSKEGSKAQKALGGSIEELGLLGAIERLSELKLSTGSIIEIFGKPGSPVAAGLTNARQQYLQFLGEIENSEGALKKGGDLINDTLTGNLIIFKNNLLELAKTPLDSFAEGLKDTFFPIVAAIKFINEKAADGRTLERFKQRQESLGVDPFKLLGVSQFASGGTQSDALKKYNEELDKASKDDAMKASLARGEAWNAEAKAVKTTEQAIEELVAKFDKLTLDFDVYEAFGGTFDFDKTSKDLEALANALLKIGAREDAVKVMREIANLQEAEKKAAQNASKRLIDLTRIVSPLTPEEERDRADGVERRDKRAKKLGKTFDESTQKTLKAEAENLAKLNEELKKFELESSVSFEAMQISATAFHDSISLIGVGLTETFFGKEGEIKNFGDSFERIMRQMAESLIALTIRFAIFRFVAGALGVSTGGFGFASTGGTGFLDAVLGGLGGSLKPTKAANGFDGMVTGPRLFLAGEGGEPERVKITPLSKMGSKDGGDTYNITVQGDVFDSEKLVDKVALTNERTRTRYV